MFFRFVYICSILYRLVYLMLNWTFFPSLEKLWGMNLLVLQIWDNKNLQVPGPKTEKTDKNSDASKKKWGAWY